MWGTNIFDQMSRDPFDSANIEYVKWDFNRNLTEVGSELLPPERQSEIAHRYMLGVYELLETAADRVPASASRGLLGRRRTL